MPTAARGSAPLHNAETSWDGDSGVPSCRSSTARAARCWGGPSSISTSPRHARTGPRTSNRIASVTQSATGSRGPVFRHSPWKASRRDASQVAKSCSRGFSFRTASGSRAPANALSCSA